MSKPGTWRQTCSVWKDKYLGRAKHEGNFSRTPGVFGGVLWPQASNLGLSLPRSLLGLRGSWVCREAHDRYWTAVDGARTFPIIAHNNWVKGHRKKLAAFRNTNLWLLWHLRSQERDVHLSTIRSPGNLTRLTEAWSRGKTPRRLLRLAGALGPREPR